MTIKPNTPVAAAMGVFAFGEVLPSVDFRLRTFWGQSGHQVDGRGAKGRVHRASASAAIDPAAYRRCPTRRCLFMPRCGRSRERARRVVSGPPDLPEWRRR
jgi:hypothetical protein